jgi:ribosomal protein S12 methylthiotransferase accessory factor
MDFPGGARVRAEFDGLAVETDQPAGHGGEGAAPTPFDTFLASIGTCAGVYVLNFLRRREIPADGIRLTLETTDDPQRKMLSRITLRLAVPAEFPERYRGAIARAVDLCSVKRHILDPPQFETIVESVESVKSTS